MSWKSRANEHRRQPFPLTPLLFLGSHISLELFYAFLIMSRAFASSLISAGTLFCTSSTEEVTSTGENKPTIYCERALRNQPQLWTSALCHWTTTLLHFWGVWSAHLPGMPPVQTHDKVFKRHNESSCERYAKELDKESGDHYQRSKTKQMRSRSGCHCAGSFSSGSNIPPPSERAILKVLHTIFCNATNSYIQCWLLRLPW